MATINTPKFGNDKCPVFRLVVEPEPGGDAATTFKARWTVYYVATNKVNTGGAGRRYVAKIGTKVIVDKEYNIDGKTGTIQLATGTHTFTKSTSAQTVSISLKVEWKITWGSTYKSSNSVSGNVTVPAKSKYTIGYNANGGSGAPGAQSKWAGTDIKLSTVKPTRTGWTFKGWATSSTGAVAYASGATYKGNANATLYAVWARNTYTVSFNANGGTGAPANQTKQYGLDLKITTAKPTRAGYIFKGWATSKTGSVVMQPGGTYKGNSAVTYYAIWQIGYQKPRISALSVTRCSVDGTVVDDGTYALVKFSWSTDNAVSSIKIDWKLATSTSYGTATNVTASGTSGTVSVVIGDGGFSTEQRYTIRITVTDSGGNNNMTRELPTVHYIMDIKSGGTGVAFGKVAELNDILDIMYRTLMRDNLTFMMNKGIWSYYADGTSSGVNFQPVNDSDNCVVGYGNYENKRGNLNLYGFDVNLGVSNIAKPGIYRPYWRRGDTISCHSVTTGWVTNSGNSVYFSLPLRRPIIGAPTVTATSVNGVVIRQGNKYLYGSSASAYAKPSSYSCAIQTDVIQITMRFPNATNVTNNDTVGIVWNGKITLS